MGAGEYIESCWERYQRLTPDDLLAVLDIADPAHPSLRALRVEDDRISTGGRVVIRLLMWAAYAHSHTHFPSAPPQSKYSPSSPQSAARSRDMINIPHPCMPNLRSRTAIHKRNSPLLRGGFMEGF